MKIPGCVHVHIDQDGKIGNIFVYLSDLPKEKGVIHLTMDGGEFLTPEQFLSTHAQFPRSRDELTIPPARTVYHPTEDEA